MTRFLFARRDDFPFISGSMFQLTVMGSGSAGNCALLTTEGCRLLVDAGLSARQIVLRLAQVGLTPEELDGVLLTHEHCDHASGLEVLCRKYQGLPIYCNKLTAEVLRHDGGSLAMHRNWQLFQTGADFEINDVGVQTFSVPHDAVDPVGYMFHHGAAALGYLTDLGFATKLGHERVRQATTLLMETNHDSALLHADTKRPWSVKQRIMSRHGHLSNEAAAAVIEKLLAGGAKLKRTVLGHLSRDCNRPDLAISTVRRLGGDSAVELEIVAAAQGEISARMTVEQRPPEPERTQEVEVGRVAEERVATVAATKRDFLQLDLFAA